MELAVQAFTQVKQGDAVQMEVVAATGTFRQRGKPHHQQEDQEPEEENGERVLKGAGDLLGGPHGGEVDDEHAP